MILNKCDNCGKETKMSPLTEPQYLEIDDGQGNVLKVPKMTKMKRQNYQTGEIEDIDIHEIKDLEERTYSVRLTIGSESIVKDFCLDCLKDGVLPNAQILWDQLKDIKSQ